MPSYRVLIARPLVSEAAISAVMDTLRSRWIGQGPKVDEFEAAFAAKFKLDRELCVAVNSGTAALELAYDLVGISPGDRVVTTPLTCTATTIPLLRRRAVPIFADILRETLNLDSANVAATVKSTRVKVIVNVHLHGVESPLPDFGIDIIHDAAQALGIFSPGRFTCCSFQAIKHVTTGDGGMLVCRDREDADKARLLRWFGIDRRRKMAKDWQPFQRREILYDIEVAGYKFHMNDIAAALGLVGLEEYDLIMARRRRTFGLYRRAGLPMVDGPLNVYGYACLLVEDRDRFAAGMAAAGIETNVMHVRNDLYSIFARFRRPLPNLDWVHERHICIPLHNAMSAEDAEYVATTAGRLLAEQIYAVPT